MNKMIILFILIVIFFIRLTFTRWEKSHYNDAETISCFEARNNETMNYIKSYARKNQHFKNRSLSSFKS